MWGEFENDEKKEEKGAPQESPSSDADQEPSAVTETPRDTARAEDKSYSLPLRDRLLHSVASSNAVVKSQQRYEPDLTYDERRDIVDKLLSEKPGQFLYRFGKYLEREHLHYFLKYEGDAEVDYFLAETLKLKNEHTAKITVRNRRYAALQQLRRSGDYFSEQEMERRDPLLYDHLVRQHQTPEEREERFQVDRAETKFSSLLLHHYDNHANKELKKQQEEEEDDMFEEEDTDEEEEEEDEDEEMVTPVEPREKQLFKEEFYSAGYNNFIRGQDKDFDYKQVDNNDEFDMLDIHARDEEERYFDEEEEGTNMLHHGGDADEQDMILHQ